MLPRKRRRARRSGSCAPHSLVVAGEGCALTAAAGTVALDDAHRVQVATTTDLLDVVGLQHGLRTSQHFLGEDGRDLAECLGCLAFEDQGGAVGRTSGNSCGNSG